MLPGILLCQPAVAQVRPSGSNVKPIRPNSKNVRKPGATNNPGPASAKPRVIIREKTRVIYVPKAVPPPPPDPRLVAARRWQESELKALQGARTILELLQAPRIDKVAYPVEPPLPPQPEPEIIQRQRATLLLTRDDGAPFDAKRVRIQAPGFQVRAQASVIELEGPAASAAMPVVLGLPDDYSMVNAADGRISLSANSGQETRTQLEPKPAPPAPQFPTAPLLFTSDAERAALQAKILRLKRPPTKPGKAPLYATPAAMTSLALRRVLEGRRFLEPVVPIAATAAPETRRTAWGSLEEAIRLLTESEAAINQAQRTLDRLAADKRPYAALKEEYRLPADDIRELLKTARIRRLQYIAEAQWWRALCENPGQPDREPAAATLRTALALDSRSPETTAQLSRYEEVAERESELRARIRAGAFNPRPTPRVQVTRHLTRTIVVRRNVVDLRMAENELRPGDVVTVGGDPKKAIAFKLEGGHWRARVPRDLVKTGQLLRVSRQSAQSDLEGEATAGTLDPYNLDGNEVSRTPFRLATLRAYTLASSTPEERVAVLEELAPADREEAKLRDARKRGSRDVRPSEDGSWWISAGTGELLLRLRPSPYPMTGPGGDARPRGGSLEKSVTGFFRKITGRADRNRSLTGRVIVDTARLTGPNDGHVAGVKVGSTAQQVEDSLGGRVPRNGVITYANGAVEVGMRAGLVEYLEVRRDLEELLGKPVPASVPGTVTEIRHDANRLRARTGPDFPAQPGTEFEVLVAGQPLAGREEETYRAIVLDAAGGEIVCKLVRKLKNGTVAGDAEWDVLRSLPTGDSGVVQLRRPL